MLNNIPIVGWLLDLIFKGSLGFVFWIVWTQFGIGVKYFYFLPEIYQIIPFWSCVGLFICLGILKSFSPFVSTNVNIPSFNNKK